MALLSAYVVWQFRLADYASSGRASLNIARLIADDVGNSFDRLDATLKSVGRLYVDSRDSGPEENARLVEYTRFTSEPENPSD